MTNAPPPPASPDGADPSMEEILASIRRILNDDEVPAAEAPPAAEPAAEEPAAEDDVLILDDSMIVGASDSPPEVSEAEPAPPADTSDPFDFQAETFDVQASAPTASAPVASAPVASAPVAPEPVTLPVEAEPPPQAMEAAPAEPMAAPVPNLLGPEAAAAAASSVGSLVRTLAAGRATQVYGGGPTLEDMVRAELRPLLKEWLDVYLPPMVERLVRIEIERVVGRCVP